MIPPAKKRRLEQADGRTDAAIIVVAHLVFVNSRSNYFWN